MERNSWDELPPQEWVRREKIFNQISSICYWIIMIMLFSIELVYVKRNIIEGIIWPVLCGVIVTFLFNEMRSRVNYMVKMLLYREANKMLDKVNTEIIKENEKLLEELEAKENEDKKIS